MASTPRRALANRLDADAARIQSALRRVLRAALLLAAVTVIGTFGYMLLMDWNLVDALYMTVITVGIVGYEEVHDLSNDPAGRLWTIALIISGVASLAYAASTIGEFIVEGTVRGYFHRRRMEAAIDKLSGHYILCGYGRVGREIADEFAAEGVGFVIIDHEESNIEECMQKGYLALLGNASEDELLERVGVRQAKGLVAALDSDAANMFVVISAREVNPDLYIVSRVEADTSVRKLEIAGADRTLSPYAVGGKRLARMTIHPFVVDYLDIITSGSDENVQFRLEEFEVEVDSPLAERTVGQLKAAESETGARLLSIRHKDRRFNTNPSPEDEILPGDVLIVLGTREQVTRIERLVGE
jgi:voltage-gated potassium channel